MLHKLIYVTSRASRRLVRIVSPDIVPEQKTKIDEANDLVRQYIEADQPCMIARFGYVELEVVCTYLIRREPSLLQKIRMFYKGGRFYWDRQLCDAFANNAGFFPAVPECMEQYAQNVIAEMKLVDVLHSWRPGEKNCLDYFSDHAVFVSNYHPYMSSRPWMTALKGKNVLVISPFAKTIEHQYKNNRERLFRDKTMLPKFHLQTIQAVQSAAGIGKRCGFDNWFAALDAMKHQIRSVDFDIAIIGAGSYGFSLCAYVKHIGKTAIYTGGGTQLLFGIKGKRWDSAPDVSSLFNQYWVRPAPEETPDRASTIEGGCYW